MMQRLARAFGGRGLVLGVASLVLGSCSGEADLKKTPTEALIAEAKALTPDKIEGKANEISQNDYRMFRSLMAAGGLDEELGGAAQGDAALRGLMLQFRQQMLGTRANLPRLVRTDGGEASGFAGMGASFFAGLLLTKGIVSVSIESKDSRGKFGPPERGPTQEAAPKDGTFEGAFDEGSVTSSSSFIGEISGLKGQVSTKIRLDTCPKPDGAITVDFESDSALTKVGGTSGANVKVTAKATWFVNDDAEFGDKIDTDIRVQNAFFGGARGSNGSFVDYTKKMSSVKEANNSGTVNRSSSRATQDDVATAAAAAKFAELMVMMTMMEAKAKFQSGKCVKLEPTSDPAKRNGAKPKTSFAVVAAPRSKLDGTPTGGSVKAALTGAGGLDPAGSKVPADAKFTYVAGEKDTKSSVAFEARSKRGIGKATLGFDTMNRAYLVNGGSPPMVVSGKACNLAEPFTLTNSTFKMNLTPSSERGGSYTWTGSYMGFGARGNGSYTVDLTDQGGSISVNGRGFAGNRSGSAVGRTFTLTPTDPC